MCGTAPRRLPLFSPHSRSAPVMHSWPRLLRNRPATRKTRPAAQRRPVSLELLRLEDRTVPAGIDPGQIGLQHIDHFVVIYQENWSFDSLYPNFPGANGIANATNPDGSLKVPQVSKTGQPLTSLPAVLGPDGKPDPRFPTNLPVQPYNAVPYLVRNEPPGDPAG